ncbi:MAG: twin-arginine translocation signal domain-containing protein [Anaerolineae bacterium]|nr:twin-arginine translocation signal domain-containing protein [Anaerolineae bacterium]
MSQVSRRHFIKMAGIAAATLVLGRTAYAGARTKAPRGTLWRCWLQAAEMEYSARGISFVTNQRKLESLIIDHRKALDTLVKRGEIDHSMADKIDKAFRTDLCHHIPGSFECRSRVNALPMAMCYMVIDPPLWQQDINELFKQAEILVKAGWVWPLDDELLAQARANVERDYVCLRAPAQDRASQRSTPGHRLGRHL